MKKNYPVQRTGTLVLSLLLLLGSSIFAQPIQAPRYGKISPDELNMKISPVDSGANAVILHDVGYSYFSFANDDFRLNHERRCRIKILNKAGFDAATVYIPYSTSPGAKEQIVSLKGATWIIEDGKPKEYKLDGKSVFDELVRGTRRLKKFTLPNIREGAVIEYAYTISSSSLLYLTDWDFQNEYPTLWSEFTAKIPEYFDYTQRSQGFTPFYVNEKKEGTEQFGTQITCSANIFHWVQKDVPAFKDDNYISSRNNYITKVRFQLQGLQYPQSPYRPVLNSWEKVTEEIFGSDGFASAMSRPSVVKEKVKELCLGKSGDRHKAMILASYIKNNIKWDQYLSMWPSASPRQLMEKKSGNSAEINLLLIGMLREAGLKADPVLISSRKNGIVNRYYPLIDNFNDVLAAVEIDSTRILMDATDPYRAPYLLPEYCLNDVGRLIKADGRGEWIDLETTPFKTKASTLTYMRFKDGKLNGNVIFSASEYAAANNRSKLAGIGTDSKYIHSQFDQAGYQIRNIQVINANRVDTALTAKFDFESDEDFDGTERIYISPLLFASKIDNEFKAKERQFPISFSTLKSESFISTIEIPEGYEIDELPKSAKIDFSEGAATFQYLIGRTDNQVQLRYVLNVNRKEFPPEEYPHLKNFYAALANKQTEQIVFKKTAKQ